MSAPDAGKAAKRERDDIVLAIALAALATLYLIWYRDDSQRVAVYTVFAMPPLLLSLRAAFGGRRVTRFLAGVLALLWFSHGIMIAWAHGDQRGYALVEVALSVTIIFAANASALRSKITARSS